MSEIHARLLLTERESLLPLMRRTPADAFDRPTVCTEWSVRDVIAHCASALVSVSTGTAHGFTPEENQADVDARKSWPIADVLAELERGYELGATSEAVSYVALGEWMHGGDIREALGEPGAYASAGVADALRLLAEESAETGLPPVDVELTDATDGSMDAYRLGDPKAAPVGRLRTDIAGLFRIIGGRRPEQAVYSVDGRFDLEDLRLFF